MKHRGSGWVVLFSVVMLGFNIPAQAEPVSLEVRKEIDGLLAKMGVSLCEFNRNGSWHTAKEAKKHLLRKLEYLERNDLVRTTEQFLELGASTSSSSGQPYLVKCANASVVESKVWFFSELQSIRSRLKEQSSGPP